MVERKKKPKFVRKDGNKQVKLGRGRKSQQRWVWPRGRHNKFREKRKGHRKNPSIGYSQAREIRGQVQGLQPVLVNNVQDLQKIDKQNELAVFASIGLKKKVEMAKKARELGLKTNFNIDKFLKKTERRADWEKKGVLGSAQGLQQEKKEKNTSVKEQAKDMGTGKDKSKESGEEKK